MKKKYYILFLVYLVLTSCNNCEFNNRRNLEDYSGIVVEKKYYEWDHGTKILFIKSGDEIKKFFFPTDYSYDVFWDKIEIRDSISKVKNEFDFAIYRGGEQIDSMVVKFNCR